MKNNKQDGHENIAPPCQNKKESHSKQNILSEPELVLEKKREKVSQQENDWVINDKVIRRENRKMNEDSSFNRVECELEPSRNKKIMVWTENRKTKNTPQILNNSKGQLISFLDESKLKQELDDPPEVGKRRFVSKNKRFTHDGRND